ncbi:membrane-anchored protein YejM (alkaline phosphatase superfamily) [Mucilaginibacter gotjawali]|uniref:Membrane-anchored protein YejM (Alkaline phosphatase superfamily) n=1 Tax=Mucilaginibacter gotjawali TaxID=1550579 RepID=A0A839SBR2_9SPHI|nr:membrane-anchored protein YejM (alkaline phosphatase superfamily) [Mucilaginibacter gotjawali]
MILTGTLSTAILKLECICCIRCVYCIWGKRVKQRKILKKDVAKFLAILQHHLSEIFAGKRNISARLAIKPENYPVSVPLLVRPANGI